MQHTLYAFVYIHKLYSLLTVVGVKQILELIQTQKAHIVLKDTTYLTFGVSRYRDGVCDTSDIISSDNATRRQSKNITMGMADVKKRTAKADISTVR